MSEFFQVSLDQTDQIANAWLASGASSFSFWTNGTLLKKWQNGAVEDEITLSAPVQIKDLAVGEIRLTGSKSRMEKAQNRLSIDAQLISDFIRLKNEQRLLCEEIIDTRDQLLILSSINNVTQKVFDLEGLLKVLATNAHKLVKVEEVFFLLQTADQPPICESYPQQTVDPLYLGQIAQKNPKKGQPFLIADNKYSAEEKSNHNYLVVPIQVMNAQLAVLIFINSPEREFSSYEVKLAKAIGDYSAAQIEKINLMRSNIEMARMETEIDLAQKIQQSLLLGDLPRISGLDICLAFQPASRIGGDYYDMIWGCNEIVNFVIGDISGKGMPAALFMAMTLKVIRSVAVMTPFPPPDVIINQSNEILYKDYNDAVMFSTLFVGQYNTVTRELLYSNAGHSPIIYYPKGKKAEMLMADSVPVGIFPEMKCQVKKVLLSPGDILVMATDGINETSNKSSRLFGFTQLMMVVEMLSQKSALEIKNGILDAVKVYGAGKNQEDDRAMIVIKGE